MCWTFWGCPQVTQVQWGMQRWLTKLFITTRFTNRWLSSRELAIMTSTRICMLIISMLAFMSPTSTPLYRSMSPRLVKDWVSGFRNIPLTCLPWCRSPLQPRMSRLLLLPMRLIQQQGMNRQKPFTNEVCGECLQVPLPKSIKDVSVKTARMQNPTRRHPWYQEDVWPASHQIGRSPWICH